MLCGFDDLKNLVINRGLCTVCGTCIGICPEKCLELVYKDEEPLPGIQGKCSSCGLCVKACPGKDIPLFELEKFCFGKIRKNRPDDFGVFEFSGIGKATDEEIYQSSGSGGIATVLLIYGLEKGLIDCALVAGFSKEKPWRTEARIATTRSELIESSQSKYAVVAVNSLLNEAVKRGYKKIGLVGCPCHVEAIRKMEYQGLVPRITEKITILIGLMCGLQFHFEGTRHALSELCGVQDLQSIARLQYKCKDDNGLPHFVVDLNNGERRSATVDEAIKGRAECFTRDRCTMCIDYSSELADISVGDYWPERGIYTAILARTSKGVNWLNGAKDANYVQMEEKPSTDYLLDCPAFETKKHGAVFRLALRQRYGWPVPNFHCRLSHEPFRPDDK